MVVLGYKRGHSIKYNENSNEWRYVNDNTPINIDRPCIRCNKMPTLEGHDACLGTLKGVLYACCGHGVEKGYIKKR